MREILVKYLGEGEAEALIRYNKGEEYRVSTSIDEDTIIAGYGDLGYDFEFTLPEFLIKLIYGTTSWAEYFKIKHEERSRKNSL